MAFALVPVEVETEVFRKAVEKARGEKLVRNAIDEGSAAVAALGSTDHVVSGCPVMGPRYMARICLSNTACHGAGFRDGLEL